MFIILQEWHDQSQTGIHFEYVYITVKQFSTFGFPIRKGVQCDVCLVGFQNLMHLSILESNEIIQH